MKGKDKLPYIGIAEKFPLLNLIIELFIFYILFPAQVIINDL